MHAMHPLARSSANLALATAWLALVGWMLWLPTAWIDPAVGVFLVKFTVRVALGLYAIAAGLMLFLDDHGWRGETLAGWLARWCWSLGAATFVVHVLFAFHYYHHWSHAHAVAHTQAVSGFGYGIYISHGFTLLWLCDAALWWLRPAAYAARSWWIGRGLHGFMLFIIFNGTIVYEQGPIRIAAAIGFAVLALLAARAWRR